MNHCTIYEDIYSDKPHYITVDAALMRIKNGKSKARIEEIRAVLDKEKADLLKRQLPSVCFSGKFGAKRTDESLINHSGFIVLDFDNVQDVSEKAAELSILPFLYALWVSPRANGLKALIRLADPKKHREHFQALQEIFPDVDKSGVNESRVCYESYDPSLYINKEALPFTKLKSVEKIEAVQTLDNEREIFANLLKWLSNRNDAFVTGERNTFIFKLAASCCRFGLHQDSATSLILTEYPPSNDFTTKEAAKAIQSAYRANKGKSGSARFDRDVLVDKVSRKEVVIDADVFDESIPPRDVVYGADVKMNALNIYQLGYASVKGVGVPKLDMLYKSKRGEVTCLTGIGNYGKSTFYKWYILMRVLAFGEKFASFSPEDNPPEEYYHDFVEMLLGCDCTPNNTTRPRIEIYNNAYDFVSKHIFYLYPKELSPTPEYIKERFLELIIKEKVSGVAIDPFNQMAHDYNKSGGRSDKYLETVLGDFARFAQANNTYFTIIAHPHKLVKGENKNYPCPDVFDLADGAMWNNKMDNILVYHRPLMQTMPDDPTCEFHSKKIRRQKTVGKKGYIELHYVRKTRRYEIDGFDNLSDLLRQNELSFNKPIENYVPKGQEPAPF